MKSGLKYISGFFPLFLTILVSTGAYAQENLNLFIEVSDSPAGMVAAEQRFDTVVRSRVVALNPKSFPTAEREPGFIVPMNFFPGSEVNVVLGKLEYRGENDYTWTGRVEGEGDGGTVSIVINGDAVVGNIRSETKGYFQIRVAEEGVLEVREIDETRFASREMSDTDTMTPPDAQGAAPPETPESQPRIPFRGIVFSTILLVCIVSLKRLYSKIG